MFEFGFATAEAILASMHGIAPQKRVAFAGRLKILVKNGIPLSARPGRGKAGSYNFEQLSQMAAALELLQAGIGPQRAARLIAINWQVLWHSLLMGDRFDGSPFAIDMCWLLSLEELASLTPEGATETDDFGAIDPTKVTQIGSILSKIGRDRARSTRERTGRSLIIYAGEMFDSLYYCSKKIDESAERQILIEILSEQKRLIAIGGQWSLGVNVEPGSARAGVASQLLLGEEGLKARAREIAARANKETLMALADVGTVSVAAKHRALAIDAKLKGLDHTIRDDLLHWKLVDADRDESWQTIGFLTPLGDAVLAEITSHSGSEGNDGDRS